MDLPKYKCHKVVSAAKIVAVIDSETLMLEVGGSKFEHKISGQPQLVTPRAVGGYYVKYLDGYESWSPAEAFESGYSRVAEYELTAAGLAAINEPSVELVPGSGGEFVPGIGEVAKLHAALDDAQDRIIELESQLDAKRDGSSPVGLDGEPGPSPVDDADAAVM